MEFRKANLGWMHLGLLQNCLAVLLKPNDMHLRYNDRLWINISESELKIFKVCLPLIPKLCIKG